MKWERLTYNVLTGVVCCLLPFSFSGEGLFTYPLHIAVYAVLFACVLIRIVYLKKGSSLLVTKSDILVCFYVLYGCIRAYFSREALPLSLFAQWTTLIVVYGVSQNTNHTLLPLFLWVSCMLQAIIGLGQFIGIVGSHHSLFHVTGSFWNPSQLGGFIACFFPLFAGELMTGKHSRWFWLGLVPPACVLVLSDSRAAWLACGVSVLYVLPLKFEGKLKIGIVTLLLVTAGIGLYFYKPLSAMGRLYIWWISKDMVLEHPLWGSGIHTFSGKYMLYQARYFHIHPDSDFAGVATLVNTPYNEFIHVFTEQGGVGLVLFVLLLGSYFFIHGRKQDKKYKGVILAFILFACFSYPGENIALLFGLVVCMGAVRGKTWFRVRLSSFLGFVVAIVLAGGIYMNMKIMQEYYSLSLVAKRSLETVDIPRYKNEPEALQYLSRVNRSLSIADRVLIQKWISNQIPAPETYCKLGNLYERLKEYDKAEQCYQVAADMIPNQIRANYFLFKLYETTGRALDAYQMAIFISRQNVKIENTFTLSVKGEIKRFLEKSR